MSETPNQLDLDYYLLQAAIDGTILGLQMTGVVPRAVGASKLVTARHPFTVIVGLVGIHSGNLAVNFSQQCLLFLASRLLGEDQKELSEDSVDAVMEVGNMIAGAVRRPLLSTGYEINQISLPSLIMGPSYNVTYARGIRSISVEFEISDLPYSSLSDRYFTTSISLLRGSGS